MHLGTKECWHYHSVNEQNNHQSHDVIIHHRPLLIVIIHALISFLLSCYYCTIRQANKQMKSLQTNVFFTAFAKLAPSLRKHIVYQRRILVYIYATACIMHSFYIK